jgi:hypothetical protein
VIIRPDAGRNLVNANIRSKAAAQGKPQPSVMEVKRIHQRITEYARSYTTLQARAAPRTRCHRHVSVMSVMGDVRLPLLC